MKKHTLIIIGCFWTIMASGQNYYPLIEEGKTWSIMSVTVPYPYPWDTTFSISHYHVSGDTILNSVTYKKLYHSTENNPESWNFSAYMREDADKKVYKRGNSNTEEILLYDFSLDVGDSILSGNCEDTYLYVDSITSMMVNGSIRLKHWISYKQYPDYHESWIEGVGSSRHIIFSGAPCFVGGHYWFLCMSADGEVVYMNPNYNYCYITGETEEKNSVFRVYPNPSGTGNMVLEFKNQEHYKNMDLKVFDVFGKQIHTESIYPQQGAMRLDTSQWPAGIYVATIFSNGQIKGKCKIVVE
ncbi:MAG: T9SS type A sorting domain-containing protein [Bacteroidales bacterium]|nr:T9SS type A sorting domain-containing protein [Bacteroidales bacterium]